MSNIIWSDATLATVPHLALQNLVGTVDHAASCWCMGIDQPIMVEGNYRYTKWKTFSIDEREDVKRWHRRN